MLARVRTLHLRVVSLCYAVALHSLYTQLPGLYGDHGLAPASVALRQMAEAAPESGLWLAWRHPTLLWLQPVSGLSVLHCMELLCLLGAGLGLTLAIVPSLATKLPLALLWLVYISLYQVLTKSLIEWNTSKDTTHLTLTLYPGLCRWAGPSSTSSGTSCCWRRGCWPCWRHPGGAGASRPAAARTPSPCSS